MKTQTYWILFLTIYCSVIKIRSSAVNDLAKAKSLLHATLKSLKANLEFLDDEREHVNLDAIIGTRMVDGKLSYIIYLLNILK